MARLDTELSEQIFKIGFVDEHFSGLLAPWWGLDGTFIESLKRRILATAYSSLLVSGRPFSFAQASSADCSTKILKGNAERRSAEIT